MASCVAVDARSQLSHFSGTKTSARSVPQRKSLDEVKKELGEPLTPAPGAPNFPTSTEVVYKELSKTTP